jgi:Zn finger protein HypA/HybF involved in hydrogenase expression
MSDPAPLKPCPFCGNEPSFQGNPADWKDESRYVELSLGCCVVMSEQIGWRRAREMTVEARTVELEGRLRLKWNTRAAPAQAEAAPEALRELSVHLSHCNFGENAGACKYGDENCPALTERWRWFGDYLQRADRKLAQAEAAPQLLAFADDPADQEMARVIGGINANSATIAQGMREYARLKVAQAEAAPKQETGQISIQEAWEAAGGEPGIKATKEELVTALMLLDEAVDAANAKPVVEGSIQVAVWCETCQGSGTVRQEAQRGVVGSGGEYPCPDCEGHGHNLRQFLSSTAHAGG